MRCKCFLFIDAPRWSISWRGTDWVMKKSLSRVLADTWQVLPPTFLFDCFYNFPVLQSKMFRGRFSSGCLRFCRRVCGWLIGLKKPDVIISQGDVPLIIPGSKVIWETYFLPPKPTEIKRDERFCRGGNAYWIKCLEEFGAKVARIAVRGSYSVNLLKSMYPEYANKVVDLGFVHDEYPAMREDEIPKKQEEDGAVEILFIGRPARLKGLPNLVAALLQLRNRGITNFRFVCVSSFLDGRVELPDGDWVIRKGEVVHDEALELFRRAQIFIMPSFRDSYGLVYHEAMANGCVVGVCDFEPQREFVAYGEAGFVVDPGSVDDIASKLERFLNDRSLRARVALSGFHRYQEKYSQEVIRSQWKAVLREVADE